MKLVILKAIVCLCILSFTTQNVSRHLKIDKGDESSSELSDSNSFAYSRKFFSEMRDNFLSINGNLTDLVESLEFLGVKNSSYSDKNYTNNSNLKRRLTRRKTSPLQNSNRTQIEEAQVNITSKLETAINSLNQVNETITMKIKSFEKYFNSDLKRINTLSRNKKKKYDNGMLFYNSLSLVMLSMLAGGLVGVVFILYFTFKKDDNSSF